jgi:hypothetical protein
MLASGNVLEYYLKADQPKRFLLLINHTLRNIEIPYNENEMLYI